MAPPAASHPPEQTALVRESSGPGFVEEASLAPAALASGASACDLLHAVPFPRIDADAAVRYLTFAFSSGDVGDAFVRLQEKATLAPSSFVPEHFADDVFLREFVARSLTVKVQGHDRGASITHLFGLVSRPPRDIAHTRFRQAVFAELGARPGLRKQLEKLHAFALQFRDLLSRRGVTVSGSTELRLGILRAVRRIVELLVSEFAGCTSGLSRLHAYGQHIAGLSQFKRMVELLDYERNRGEVDIRIRLGFDGRVRGLQTLERRENRSNPFHSTALGRWATRFLLFVRGIRASPGELLNRLMDDVFSGLEAHLVFLFQLIGDVEFYLAGSSFKDGAEQAGLAVCLPAFTEDGMPNFERLFNPLLMGEGMSVVPCDLQVGEPQLEAASIVLVTGPNSGGKTRLLQSLALAQLLAQAGLPVPAARARLPWVHGLFASIVERVGAGQSEGRLGTELLRIRHLFESVQVGSLVLMDELCSGTNPSEGEELQELVLEMLGELAPHAFITTHFLQFAARLRSMSSGLEFLQVELDAHQRPTFAFVPGVATTSLAHRVAQRLGVTRESLRELIARSNPGPRLRPTSRRTRDQG
jgi:DNA mismatch repair protein MutS2